MSLVVIQHTVVRQRKGNTRCALERMVVVIVLLITLGGHAGVSHNTERIIRQLESHQVCGIGALVDGQMTVVVIGDAGGVRTAIFAGNGQRGDKTLLLCGGQAMAVIINSKQAAHQTSPSPSTGSLM